MKWKLNKFKLKMENLMFASKFVYFIVFLMMGLCAVLLLLQKDVDNELVMVKQNLQNYEDSLKKSKEELQKMHDDKIYNTSIIGYLKENINSETLLNIECEGKIKSLKKDVSYLKYIIKQKEKSDDK